jgi:hypothetical protein
MILIRSIMSDEADVYTDMKEAAERVGMDRDKLKRRLDSSPLFVIHDLVITTKVTFHKSRRGRK